MSVVHAIQLGGSILHARKTDFYINAIQLCGSTEGKSFNDWKRNTSSIEFMNELIEDIYSHLFDEDNKGLFAKLTKAINALNNNGDGDNTNTNVENRLSDLAVLINGKTYDAREIKNHIRRFLIIYENGDCYNRSIWVHPDIAVHIAQWYSPEFALQVSRWIRNLFVNSYVESNLNEIQALKQEFAKKTELLLKDKAEEIAILRKKLHASKDETIDINVKLTETQQVLSRIQDKMLSLLPRVVPEVSDNLKETYVLVRSIKNREYEAFHRQDRSLHEVINDRDVIYRSDDVASGVKIFSMLRRSATGKKKRKTGEFIIPDNGFYMRNSLILLGKRYTEDDLINLIDTFRSDDSVIDDYSF